MPNQTYQKQYNSFLYAVWDLIGSKKFSDLSNECKGHILLSIEEEITGIKKIEDYSSWSKEEN